MDFYNDALKKAKKYNLKLNAQCKEMLLLISKNIQDMTLLEKRNYLENVICMFELEWE